MIRSLFVKSANTLSRFLQNPLKVFVVCFSLVIVGLIFDGSLFHLWRLKRDSAELATRMQVLRTQSNEIEKKINRARDPNFIELEAREKFDLASEGDLVFVFSDEE